MSDYEVPVLVLSYDTLRSYLDEDNWNWIQMHPGEVPEILDAAASKLSFLIEEYEIQQALEDAISETRDYDD